MGAYENPQPLDFNTSSAGAAWANAAAQAGAMLGKAIEERSRLDLLELEKTNKEAAEVLNSQKRWAEKKAKGLQDLRDSEDFKGLDVRLQQKVIDDHNKLFEFKQKMEFTKNPEELRQAEEEYYKQEKITSSSKDSLLTINQGVQEITAGLAGYTDDQTIRLPGTIDTGNPENKNLAIAGQIMNRINDYEGTFDLGNDEDGSITLDFKYKFKGVEQQGFTLSAADIDNFKYSIIPNIETMTMDLLTKQGVYVDGKLADKYFIKEKGEIAKKLITIRGKDDRGNIFTKTVEVPKIDEDALKKVYLDALVALPLNTKQKVSAFNNIFKNQTPDLKNKEDMSYAVSSVDEKIYLAGATGYSDVLFNEALEKIKAENSTKPNFGRLPEPVTREPNKAETEALKVLKAFETGETYMTTGGKFVLQAEDKIPEDDKAGWFKDKNKYFRVLKSIEGEKLIPFTEVKNKNQAIQFFGGNIQLP